MVGPETTKFCFAVIINGLALWQGLPDTVQALEAYYYE